MRIHGNTIHMPFYETENKEKEIIFCSQWHLQGTIQSMYIMFKCADILYRYNNFLYETKL